MPGAELHLFQLLRATRRGAQDARLPPLPDGALMANLRLPRAAGTGRPRLRETEGYAVWDPTTSRWHAQQTARVRSGRLAFVMQPHGHMSLMLVGRVGGSSAPSCEVAMLIRGC